MQVWIFPEQPDLIKHSTEANRSEDDKSIVNPSNRWCFGLETQKGFRDINMLRVGVEMEINQTLFLHSFSSVCAGTLGFWIIIDL